MYKISIIIPIYNTEKYLNRCLDSVINQTLKDIEIILIDDGSTDNSLKICKEYNSNDKRIKLIHKKNEGVSKARNIGLSYATGEYISFIDADDWVEPNMLEELYNLIIPNNTEFCMCNYIKENNGGSIYMNSNISKKVLNGNNIKNFLLIPLIEREDNEKEHTLAGFRGPCGKLFKREVIEKHNIKFENELIIGEDFLFNLEFLIHVNKAIVNEKFYYHYFTNSNSLCTKYKKDCWNSFYRNIILYIKRFLIENNIYSQTKDRVDKLIIKYFFMSIINEKRKDNPKKTVEKINAIKQICEDKIIIDCLNDFNLNLYKRRNKLILILAKYGLYHLIFIVI
ncbi:glycosyltransferase family 2 protein [Clostridium psychrophilum]|uniref:glycosyltransferase family 2 protein n=1 Tax=Clostridium psychrophilum TaxID=132926 RepID=UPI001C0C7837|nr:glycosyltransferase [Clostridium psychrophilum]MBU3180711.1 glycosyltransferase [Clostridium psychrophilum]